MSSRRLEEVAAQPGRAKEKTAADEEAAHRGGDSDSLVPCDKDRSFTRGTAFTLGVTVYVS